MLQVEKTGLATGDDDANGVIKGYLVFTYAYNSMLANTDSINTKYADLVGETIQKKTTPLFEKIRMINVVEGQLDLVSYQMPIKVFAIRQHILVLAVMKIPTLWEIMEMVFQHPPQM